MLLISVGFGISRLWDQGATATILGNVADTSGAAIPEASVQVKNVGTGATQDVTADAQGRFRAPDLIVGEYEIRFPKSDSPR